MKINLQVAENIGVSNPIQVGNTNFRIASLSSHVRMIQ